MGSHSRGRVPRRGMGWGTYAGRTSLAEQARIINSHCISRVGSAFVGALRLHLVPEQSHIATVQSGLCWYTFICFLVLEVP
jgi:hypothetical protein